MKKIDIASLLIDNLDSLTELLEKLDSIDKNIAQECASILAAGLIAELSKHKDMLILIYDKLASLTKS